MILLLSSDVLKMYYKYNLFSDSSGTDTTPVADDISLISESAQSDASDIKRDEGLF